jgi:hypothetical protein
MPTVPNYAFADTQPDAKLASLNPDAGTAADQAVAGLGDTVQKGADQLTDTALQLQQTKDQADAYNAVNQMDAAKRNILFGPQGYYSLQGKDAVDAYQPTLDKLNALQKQYAGTLNNPFAQQVYNQTSSYMLNREMDSMAQHSAQETITYRNGSINGMIDSAVQNGALNYNNPTMTDAAIHTSIDGARQLAQSEGLSPDATQDLVTKSTSQAAAAILDAAMAKDPVAASKLYDQYNSAGYLDAATSVEVGSRIRRATMPGVIADISDGVLGIGHTFISSDQANRQWQVESGGHQFGADGQPLTSPKGAVGVAQLLPDTAKMVAQQHGIPFDPVKLANDPDYNKSLGTFYMNDLMAKFNGNYPVALAAYNAGPNNPGVMHYAATGDMSQLPPETLKYVEDIAGPSLSSPQPSAVGMNMDDLGAKLPALMQQASDAATAMYPDQPDAGDQAAQRVLADYSKRKQAYDDAQSGSFNIVQSVIMQNKFTDPGQVQAMGGDVATAYADLDPEHQRSVLALMKNNIPGQDTKWTPQGQQTIDQLRGLYYTNPQAFAKVNLLSPQMLNLIPQDQISELSNLQAQTASAGARGISPSDMDGALGYVAPMLVSAGVGVKAGKIDKDDAGYQQFAGVFGQDVEAFYAKNNRMPDVSDLRAITQRLLVQGTVAGSGGMFFGPKATRLYQQEGAGGDISKFQADIPGPALQAINTAYAKQNGGRLPDVATATQIYLSTLGPQ